MQLRSTFGWQLLTECQVKFLLLCCKMKKKEHLTREQRYQISALLQAGHKQKEIAEIIGKDGKGAIVTLAERKTGFLLMEKLPGGKNADGLAKAVIRMLLPYKKWIYTITSDNGTEFAEHKTIARKLKADFFFCHPYSSWERGLNEYTNGLIKQYIPKGESFDNYDELYIKNVQHKINRRPREKLGFDCPKRLFFASLQ